jgi:predicted transcriptional regulator
VGLKEMIFDAGYNKIDFAKQIDTPLVDLEKKIDNLDFNAKELNKICEVLHIPLDKIKEVFF